MTQQEIQSLAQQLVDAKIEINRLGEEQTMTKLALFEFARGGVQCTGGMVYFVDAGEGKRFSREKLKDLLVAEGLDNIRIQSILENALETTSRDANIYIKLN